MKIPLVNLKRQNAFLKTKLDRAWSKMLDDADFIMGENLREFEKKFAAFCGKKYAVGLNSGTDAIKLALLAYGIGPGDEVLLPANGYFSSAMVVSEIRAIPKFVDIEPDFYTIDTGKIEKAITKKTKAIIPVHIYGQPADMGQIVKIAKKHNLKIIEDACQAHGAKYKGRVLPYTETGVFSFYPGKNLGAFGDGGILVTDNKQIAEKIYYLRNDGSVKKYVHELIGIKSRLHDLQAGILNVKLPYLPAWNEQRRNLAGKYSDLLRNVARIKTPKERPGFFHVYHLYVIETEKRNQLQKFLKYKGIETVIHYPIPIHLQTPYKKAGYKQGDFPVTEEKAKKILSLPLFPLMKNDELEYVVRQIKNFFNKGTK